VSKQRQAAIEAVARYFSATWERGEEPPDAYLTIAGKCIAVDVAAMKPLVAGRIAKPRLRFDKVALRFVKDLQAALHEAVPDGKAVILTITAPIRLPAKTAAALEERIRVGLARASKQLEVKGTIHGNQVQARLAKGISPQASKVIGFVHNPDADPEVLLRLTQSLLQHIGAAVAKRTPNRCTGDRWLVLANECGLPHIQTYRQVYSELSIPTNFKTILLVLAGGRVETVAG